MQLLTFNCIACNSDTINSKSNNIVQIEKGKETIKDSLINLELISQYKSGENEFFKTANEFPISAFLHNKYLYLLNYSDNKIIIIDTEKKTTKTNTQINDVIKKNNDVHFGVRQIMVTDTYFFIGFLRAVLCISNDGLIVGKIITDDNINHFTIDENSIIVFTQGDIMHFDIKGQKIASYKTENTLTGHFLNIEKVVCVSNVNELIFYNIEQLANNAKKINVPLSNIPFNEPYLACITSKYTAWYPYMKRNKIALLDLTTNNLVKIIEFNEIDFAPTGNEIDIEEGVPNFNVLTDGTGFYYIIVMKDKVLEIYRTQ